MSSNLCKSCGSKVLPTAKTCPVCNFKIRSNIIAIILKSIIYFIIALIVISIGSAILIGGKDGNSNIQKTTRIKPTEIEYQKSIALNYRAALLKDIPELTLISFKGQVMQISGEKNIIFATKPGFNDYSDDNVFLAFFEPPRMIEGDIVEIKARYAGTFTYETVLGSTRTIPQFVVDYYKVTKER